MWSVQTGRITDVLSGHEAPVSQLSFNPTSGLLASTSWDKTLKFWEIFKRSAYTESFVHSSDVLAVAHRPDGVQLCTATLDGALHFWESASGENVGQIDGRRDILGGRVRTENRVAKNSAVSSFFQSLAYSPDGTLLLAGGK